MLGRRAWSKRQVYDRARLYFELAAQKGHVGALCALAFLYANGYGVEQDYDKVDYDKARELSEQSAGQGHAESHLQAKDMPKVSSDLGISTILARVMTKTMQRRISFGKSRSCW